MAHVWFSLFGRPGEDMKGRHSGARIRKPVEYLVAALLTAIALVLVASCSAEELPYPWLSDLNASDAKASGRRLMSLDEGLHLLEQPDDMTQAILVGVHGHGSEGYEWVYPLKTLDTEQTATYFFRWDYNACPGPSADALLRAVGGELEKLPDVQRVRIVGHSYGGVLVSHLVSDWQSATPVEIHTVAAPLAGMGGMGQRCGYAPPERIAGGVTFQQWRTQHHLDGAFKGLDTDPQIVEIAGSKSTELPDTYRTHRLGHNWSISWVADEIVNPAD